jgi:radical SAM/SPASM domain FxsB family protein
MSEQLRKNLVLSGLPEQSVPSITGLLLKVASRCNLACDYCYVYTHADQGWLKQPKILTREVEDLFIQRVKEYAETHSIPELSIVFHGGEPLLYGAERIADLTERLKEAVGDLSNIDFSLQTNGVLLDKEALSHLMSAGVGVSISIDGPKIFNDAHRLNHSGRSTFDATMSALELLRTEGQSIFRGAIAVIDPRFSPSELLEFVSKLELPRFDILLPDATHAVPPKGRNDNPELYSAWLCNAFSEWITNYPHVPIRWFDSVLAAAFGVPRETDVMGFGSVALLVVETDGSVTDHDVFKIVGDGQTSLGCHLATHTLLDAANSEALHRHQRLLSLEGLSQECRSCPAVSMCGGGAVMHRFHPDRGFDAPTVYCKEMFLLLSEGVAAARKALRPDSAPTPLPNPIVSVLELCEQWTRRSECDVDKLLGFDSVHNCGFAPDLTDPFSETIEACGDDSMEVAHLRRLLPEIERLLGGFSPEVMKSIATLLSHIVVVRSRQSTEAGIFSFSDDTVPDVIYISTYVGKVPLTAEDLADSIYHEFLHHVLYHLEKDFTLLYDNVFPRFPAPWSEGLRPSAGFMHGTFVFANLSRFWRSLSESSEDEKLRTKALSNARTFSEQAQYGIATLRRFSLLTVHGSNLLDQLSSAIGASEDYQWPTLNR